MDIERVETSSSNPLHLYLGIRAARGNKSQERELPRESYMGCGVTGLFWLMQWVGSLCPSYLVVACLDYCLLSFVSRIAHLSIHSKDPLRGQPHAHGSEDIEG